MNSRMIIRIMLATSLLCNLGWVVWQYRMASPDTDVQEPKVNLVAATPEVSSTISVVPDLEESLVKRTEELRRHGLSDTLIAAALVPGIIRQFKEQILAHDTLEAAAREGSELRDEWRKLMVSMFGKEFRSRDFENDAFNPRRKWELKFQFDSEEANQRHLVLGSLCGVDLELEQKAKVVELVQQFGNDRERLFEEIDSHFDERTSEQILRCTDPNYSRAYKRAMTLTDDANGRVETARIVYEIGQLRRDGIARWKSADTSDAERSAGLRTVESQAVQFLSEELGESAVELIRLNGW